MSLPAAQSVISAAERIAPVVRRTRLLRTGGVHLKLENEQLTGSFKLRGATNVIAGLGADVRSRGVVASSAGNHGLGVAYAAKHFGVRATVFIPATAPRVKREGIAALGAKVIDNERHYDAAMAAAVRYAADHGARFINPCLGDDLLAGQGTVALEVIEDVPDIETFVVSVGGGGLLGGCAALLRARAPRARIIGVQSVNTAAMARSIEAKRVVEIDYLPTLADGLAGQVDEAALEIGQEALDEILTVSEEEIGEAMLWLLDEHGLRVEGSGAVGVAAIRSGKLVPRGETVVVVSGGNVDDDRIEKLRQ
jgi:threonine dehydratase